MNKLIVVVDDEEDILDLVAVNLKKNGFAVKTFGDSRGLFRFLKGQKPDLIILDLMLPDMDGLEICKHLKNDPATAAVPIIMLTARAEESDKIIGLELGADDYVTKPFSPKELVTRVKTVLRRFSGEKENSSPALLQVNPEAYTVSVQGKPVSLTTTEFKILSFLYARKRKVYTREELMDNIWEEGKIIIDRTIDVHIKNLREKLGKAGKLIKNIRGVGYKLEE